jgi:hypothetical protein
VIWMVSIRTCTLTDGFEHGQGKARRDVACAHRMLLSLSGGRFSSTLASTISPVAISSFTQRSILCAGNSRGYNGKRFRDSEANAAGAV